MSKLLSSSLLALAVLTSTSALGQMGIPNAIEFEVFRGRAPTKSDVHLIFSVDLVSFPPVQVGEEMVIKTQLMNVSKAPALLPLPPEIEGDTSFGIRTTCQGVLAPGAKCKVDVVFKPVDSAHFEGKIKVKSNLTAQELPVKGEGAPTLPSVVSATWGAEYGARGNLTATAKAVCQGLPVCALDPADLITDPYPGHPKSLKIEFTCAAKKGSYAWKDGEAGGIRHAIACKGIDILSASLSPDRSKQGNLTKALRALCSPRLTCSFTPVRLIADPSFGTDKRLEVLYACPGQEPVKFVYETGDAGSVEHNISCYQ